MTPRGLPALEAEVAALRTEVTELRDGVHDLVEAWRLATGLLRVVKVISAIAAGLAALWSFIGWAAHFTPKGH